ncbi:MAG TPA: response regulator [Chloroflexota bacterium]|nr:response regulator [Chloroflexota bacterium]
MAIRTLVVDDDFMVANVHKGFVERVPGFTVTGVAHSAAGALTAIEERHPDLVILDIYLPDRSGLSLLQDLRHDRREVDVIMVTAAKDVASLQEAMQGGALHYIIKPFDFARFQQTLESYRRFRQERNRLATAEQADVDRLYRLMASQPDHDLPKGLNRPTLERVIAELSNEAGAASALEVAARIGISRATARRYLEYLEERGQAALELRYGAAGRPEHRYRLR